MKKSLFLLLSLLPLTLSAHQPVHAQGVVDARHGHLAAVRDSCQLVQILYPTKAPSCQKCVVNYLCTEKFGCFYENVYICNDINKLRYEKVSRIRNVAVRLHRRAGTGC